MDEKKPKSKRTSTAAASGKSSKASAEPKKRASTTKRGATASARDDGAASGAAKKKKKGTSSKRTSLAPPAPAAPTDPTTLRREASKKTAVAVAAAALDKKAERIEIVDISEKVDYADFLVIMTGRSDRQVVAIAQHIEESLETKGVKTVGMEGLAQGHWVLIDLAEVIVHVFLDEARQFYDIEGLWMDAPRVPVPTFTAPKGTPSGAPPAMP